MRERSGPKGIIKDGEKWKGRGITERGKLDREVTTHKITEVL